MPAEALLLLLIGEEKWKQVEVLRESKWSLGSMFESDKGMGKKIKHGGDGGGWTGRRDGTTPILYHKVKDRYKQWN